MHVFISYSHADGDFAEVLRTRLKEGGFDVWTDEDKLLAGEDWRNGIDQAIRSACALIVVVTPSAKASEYVTYEWAFAWGLGVKVIPILLEPATLHPRLDVLQYLDFSIRSARPWDQLLARLKEVSTNSRTGSPPGQDRVALGIPGIVQNALSSLDNVDPNIRVKAVQMLASMQHPVTRDAVLNALKHPMSDVRKAAAAALGKIKDPAAVPALIEALRDEDSGVRQLAAAALGKIKDPAAVPALIEALRDIFSDVRSRAAAALGEIKDPAAVPALTEALRDEDRGVRGAVAAALWEINK
jgi:HEAT repeat protein